MILAGDIGGTKTILAIFDDRSDFPEILAEQRFANCHFGSLEAILRRFVAVHERLTDRVDRICLGVAGPVADGRCVTTNLPWIVDARKMAALLGGRPVELINDIEAIAYGAGFLEEKDFKLISRCGGEVKGSAAIIAAGTGLGEALVYWDGAQHLPAAGEGGHTDFAARNELEIELLRFLLERFQRVSWERVLSGPGLCNIYCFLRDTGRGWEPAWLTREMEESDPAAVIANTALLKRNTLCESALRLFVSLYGAEAGNLALKTKATGVYIGGGIGPRIINRLSDGTFMRAFCHKGRMQPLMKNIPVRVILNENAALLGAAHYAWLRKTGQTLILGPQKK